MQNPVTPNEYMRLLKLKEKHGKSKKLSKNDINFLLEIVERLSGHPSLLRRIGELHRSDIDLLFEQIEHLYDSAEKK